MRTCDYSENQRLMDNLVTHNTETSATRWQKNEYNLKQKLNLTRCRLIFEISRFWASERFSRIRRICSIQHLSPWLVLIRLVWMNDGSKWLRQSMANARTISAVIGYARQCLSYLIKFIVIRNPRQVLGQQTRRVALSNSSRVIVGWTLLKAPFVRKHTDLLEAFW